MKFISFKDFNRRQWGKNAIIGLLGGGVLGMSGILLVEIIGGIVSLMGVICGIIWIKKIVGKEQ